MTRKRSTGNDWICQRCGCPCTPPEAEPRHYGGGQGMRACKREPDPILRSRLDAEMMAIIAGLHDR